MWKLKKYVFYNLTSANIGGPFYAHDIGGTYKGTENNELYTLVIDYRFHVAVIKKNLDSIEEFETFMLNHFTGLKKKKIIL